MSTALPPLVSTDAEESVDLEHSNFSMAHRKPSYPVTIMMPYVDGIRGPVVASMLYYAKHLDLGFELVGNTVISQARNELVGRFLRSNAEWSFWVDSDVFIPYGKADPFVGYTRIQKGRSFAEHNTLLRMMSHNKPLVGGVYAGRFRRAPLTIQPDLEPRNVHDQRVSQALRDGKPAGGLQPVNWVAAGLMLVHRAVFEKIADSFPFQGAFPGANYPFFIQTETVGEDVYFCQQAKACGIQAWLDTDVRAGHIGLSFFMPEDSAPIIPLRGNPPTPPPPQD
jgi:hypothetical protein